MTREDIIKLAREAGFEQLGPDIEDWVCFTEEIERFAALVAAAEREKQAEAFQQILTATRNETRAAEREACAKVCEELLSMVSTGDEHMDGVLDCLAAIRARGQA